jgi:hypothetical protein
VAQDWVLWWAFVLTLMTILGSIISDSFSEINMLQLLWQDAMCMS